MPTPCSSFTRRGARFAVLALAAGLAACASTPDTPQQRAAYIAELAQAYDIQGIVSRAQTDALADAHRNIEIVRGEFADVLGQASTSQQHRLDAAMDRFVTAARGTPDVNAAAAVWAQGFAENLTNQELRQIVEFSRTPAGQAQIAGTRDAGVQLRAYLAQQRSASVDRAAQQYIAELRAIVAGR
jgi:putative NIF3 family GTP cyclohydrolase 1 type 2